MNDNKLIDLSEGFGPDSYFYCESIIFSNRLIYGCPQTIFCHICFTE